MIRFFLLLAIFLLVSALERQELDAKEWTHRERAHPASLRQCEEGHTMVINYNSGAYAPWQAFCYGKPGRDKK